MSLYGLVGTDSVVCVEHSSDALLAQMKAHPDRLAYHLDDDVWEMFWSHELEAFKESTGYPIECDWCAHARNPSSGG